MAEVHGSKIKLFALSSSKKLGQEIADYIGIPLSDCESSRFADGEVNINIPETVRGYNVFIIQSTSFPVNENYMELLIFIDALKRASAKTINVIMPYYGYSRQDRKAKSRQPISAKLVADLLEAAGADRVVACDLHAAQIQGFYDIPIDNFEANPVLVHYFKKQKIEDIVIVSPDHGGTTRARKFAINFDAPIAIMDKRRPKANVAEVLNIIGEVEGKNCILVDDIVDTAGTISAAANALANAGAKDIYVACTHLIASGEAVQRIMDSPIKTVVATNTIELPEDRMCPKFLQLSVAKILGQGILNIMDGKPISTLFTYNAKEFDN